MPTPPALLLLRAAHPRQAVATGAVLAAAAAASGRPLREVALVGGTLHPIGSPDFEGAIVLQGGRIVAMGAGLSVPANARVIDATGKHVWPGMIALDTPLGLYEIGSVRATVDGDDIGGKARLVLAEAGPRAHQVRPGNPPVVHLTAV